MNEDLPVDSAPELVFGLVAPIGVDLDLVSDALGQTLHEVGYKARSFRVTDLMKEVRTGVALTDTPYIKSFEQKIAYANAVRGILGDSALASLAISAIRTFRSEAWRRLNRKNAKRGISKNFLAGQSDEERPLANQAYIIRQFKRPEEISLMRSVYGRQFILVSAYAPQSYRIQRIEDKERQSCGGLVSDVELHSRALKIVTTDSNESLDRHGQNLRDAFPLGDVFIDATSRSNCEDTIRRFIHLLFGDNHITPTHDEYGMYIAKSASLRSSDLSRQVGAAIFRGSGEVTTLGCNEVPKAGGGTYWTGDTPDRRDFVEGHDPNERRKVEILVDLLDRLMESGSLSRELLDIKDPYGIAEKLLSKSDERSIKRSKVMDIIEFGRIIHAEMSAITDAARKGVSVENGTLYCTVFPCHICAKHIVSSGIGRVVFLEPYPKSYAFDLHKDSIAVDSDIKTKKVSFDAFIGVSPYRYRDLFEKGKRKYSTGEASKWHKGTARPMIDVLYPTYFRAETLVVSELEDIISEPRT